MSYEDIMIAYNKYWSNDPDERNFIIKENESQIGWLKINGLNGNEKIWISELIISGKFQNKGYGTNTIKFIEKYVKESKFEKICIMTQEDNINAISFYKKNGYEIINEKIGIADNGENIKNIVFQKIINQ